MNNIESHGHSPVFISLELEFLEVQGSSLLDERPWLHESSASVHPI